MKSTYDASFSQIVFILPDSFHCRTFYYYELVVTPINFIDNKRTNPLNCFQHLIEQQRKNKSMNLSTQLLFIQSKLSDTKIFI